MTKRVVWFMVLVSGALLMGTPAYAAEVSCFVDQVSMKGNRVHVHCEGQSPIAFFALPLTSPAAVSFQLMGQQVFAETVRVGTIGGVGATVGGQKSGPLRPLVIQYDENDTSGASFGCAPQDCRKPVAFSISK